MEKEIYVLKVMSSTTIPEVAKEFFPNPDDGYLFLERNLKNTFDVYKKYLSGKEEFVETISAIVADNMIRSVNDWNKKFLKGK